MSKLVTGVLRDRSSVMMAIEDLVRHGFSKDDVTLLMSESTRGKEFIVDEHTKAPEGIAIGATVGGLLGAIALGLTAVGVVAAPGVGLTAVGPWLPMLTGLGAGALGGGLIGGLIGLGIPEHEAKFYQGEIEKGGILLGMYVDSDERAKEAAKLLEADGAEHVRVQGAKIEQTSSTTSSNTATTRPPQCS